MLTLLSWIFKSREFCDYLSTVLSEFHPDTFLKRMLVDFVERNAFARDLVKLNVKWIYNIHKKAWNASVHRLYN